MDLLTKFLILVKIFFEGKNFFLYVSYTNIFDIGKHDWLM